MAKKYKLYQQGFKNDRIMRQNAVLLIRQYIQEYNTSKSSNERVLIKEKIDNLIKYLKSVYTLKIKKRAFNGSKRLRLKLNKLLDSQKSPSASASSISDLTQSSLKYSPKNSSRKKSSSFSGYTTVPI